MPPRGRRNWRERKCTCIVAVEFYGNACVPPISIGTKTRRLLHWNYRKAADVRGNGSFLLFPVPVADDFPFHHVDHVFGNISGHIGQPFQVLGNGIEFE